MRSDRPVEAAAASRHLYCQNGGTGPVKRVWWRKTLRRALLFLLLQVNAGTSLTTSLQEIFNFCYYNGYYYDFSYYYDYYNIINIIKVLARAARSSVQIHLCATR